MSEAETCTLTLIKAASDACAYVTENCDNQEVIKFTQLYYCELEQNSVIIILFAPIFLFIMFHMVYKVADEHLAPSISNIAKKLNMSQTLAGVTVIAFANGAPDVLTALSAARSDSGLLIAVGSILGEGLICTTIGIGLVIYNSAILNIDKISFNRDIIFNILAISVLLIFAYIGNITLFMAVCFVSIYVIYIMVALICERFSSDYQAIPQDEDELELILDNQQTNSKLYQIYQFYDKGIATIREYTIPARSEKEYHRFTAIIQCFVCPLLILLFTDGWGSSISGIPNWLIYSIMSLIILILILLDKQPMFVILMLCAFISLLWCDYCVEAMVDFIYFIQVLTSMNPTYLGMTFLAFGNSLGDLFVDIRFSQMNLGVMALTGCYAGILFEILIGFGGALVKIALRNQADGIKFALFEQFNHISDNSIASIVILAFLVNIVITIILAIKINYVFDNQHVKYYIAYYVLFFLVVSICCLYLQ